MSRVLFLTSVYDYNEKGNLNVDLIDVFSKHGHQVTVMTPKERKYHPIEKKETYGNITFLQFKCLNFRGKVNVIEKGIATLSLGYQYKSAWKKHFSNEEYDLLIYTTLPITYSPIIKYIKKKCGAYCYLQQKDFFPQSAVDLGILKKGSIAYRLFRRIEVELFNRSDKIGVMSPKSIEFITNDNPSLPREKVEVCPNGINPTPDEKLEFIRENKSVIREKYGIPQDSIVFLYGGNISRAQGIPFIKELITNIVKEPIDNLFLLIIGSGNEYETLEKHIRSLQSAQIRILPYMPKTEFDEVLGAADVGMVFLDPRFTIANIPSRTLAHIDMGQPIIAATDEYTDYRQFVEENELGLWCANGDVAKMIENLRIMTNDAEFRERCGCNARDYMLKHSTAEEAYQVIMNSFNSCGNHQV